MKLLRVTGLRLPSQLVTRNTLCFYLLPGEAGERPAALAACDGSGRAPRGVAVPQPRVPSPPLGTARLRLLAPWQTETRRDSTHPDSQSAPVAQPRVSLLA